MMSGVVVGVDGSAESEAALRFAVAEAARRGTRLRVVTAFQPPDHWAAVYGVPITLSSSDVEANVLAETRRLVDQVLAGVDPAPATDVRALAGGAAQMLLDTARDADLLVIGHRGRGGFTSMLLGSVSLECVLHARCPVTVVRPSPVASGAPVSGTSSDAAS